MKLAFILCAEILLFCTDGMTKPFSDPEHPDPNTRNDTVFIHKGRYFLNSHISINIPRDTFYIMHPNRSHGKSSGSVEDSKAFYDTVYKVFSRKKITQFLYYLAFVAPKQSDLPDSVQVIRNASPFEEFHGKLIRKISVRVLSPFGTNVYDTGRQTVTGVGNALNDIHVNSRKYVIRRNLIVKEGDRDPIRPGG